MKNKIVRFIHNIHKTKIVIDLDEESENELKNLSPIGNVRDGLARAIAMGITYHEIYGNKNT